MKTLTAIMLALALMGSPVNRAEMTITRIERVSVEYIGGAGEYYTIYAIDADGVPHCIGDDIDPHTFNDYRVSVGDVVVYKWRGAWCSGDFFKKISD